MNSYLFRTFFVFALALTCFSMAANAEKAYLPEALKTVEQIKNQQGKIDGYRGNQYVPVIPGADLAKVGQGYELPKHLKPYELQTSQGTVQFYKLPKSTKVPKSVNYLPLLPEISKDEKQVSLSDGATGSTGAGVVAGQENMSATNAAASTPAKTSSSPANQSAPAKKKIGFWGF